VAIPLSKTFLDDLSEKSGFLKNILLGRLKALSAWQADEYPADDVLQQLSHLPGLAHRSH